MPAKQRRKFSPTLLNTYEQCPERYYLQYVEGRRKPEGFFEPSLERGSAVHNVLRDSTLEYMEHESVPTNIWERASTRLKRERYPSEEEWQRDLEGVVKDIEYGLVLFDGSPEVLAVEKEYCREFLETESNPRFVLAARVDLVLYRCDEDGSLIIDVIDFKSGKGTSNPVQDYACHTVVELHASRYRVPFNYVRTTIVRTSVSETVSFTPDRAERDYQQQHVISLAKAILEDQTWEPKESPRCKWCPYREHGCSLAPDVDRADQLGDWLDGAES